MKIIPIFFFVLFFHYSNGQTSFEAVFNSTGDHEEGIGCVSLNGGYSAAGIIIPCYPCQEGIDYLLIDSLGGLISQHYFALNQDANAYLVHQDKQNNLIVAGQMINTISNHYDMFLQKTDPSGNLMWQKQFISDTTSSILPKSICNTIDSGYFVDYISASEGVHVMKINNSGDSLFTKRLGYPFHGGVFMSPLHDSTFIMLATKYDSTVLNYSLIKIDSSGDTLWTNGFAKDSLGLVMKIVETTDYGFAATANLNGHGNLNPLCIIRFDPTGNAMWCKPFYTPYIENFNDIFACNDNSFITAGVTIDSASNTSRGFLYKTDANGDSLWFREYEPSYSSSFHSVVQTADHGFLACGTIGGYDSLPPSLLIIKTDSLGNVLSTLGIQGDESVKSINISPVPAFNFLRVRSTKNEEGTITISDMQGKIIRYENKKQMTDVTIEVSQLKPGLYLLSVSTVTGKNTATFIKM